MEKTFKRVAFVSGTLDLTREQFDLHYERKIAEAIGAGHHSVVGNAFGADRMTLEYLCKHCPRFSERVPVYHHESWRDHATGQKGWPKSHLSIQDQRDMGFTRIRGNLDNFTRRDTAMTRASHYDIAWVRPADETRKLIESTGKRYRPDRVSGTEKNLLRRAGQHQKGLI